MEQKRNAIRLIMFSFLIFALTAGLSYAQRLTGTIRGIVTDEAGLPLPGVTVELSSPVLLGGYILKLPAKRPLPFCQSAAGIVRARFPLGGVSEN